MAQAQDRHYKPIPRLTPGDALNVTAEDICRPGHAEIEGKISVQVKSQVFDRYGIRGTLIGYNVDHLIPPGLGGSNSITNLWPEPLAGEWTYQMKSRLERRLRKLVCSGTLDLKVAQQEIATDWIGAYKKYYPLRLGVKIFNVTNHFNPFPEVVTDQRVSRRDYQGKLASAEFAGFYNGVGRQYGLKFMIE